jgi:hypothetical protein
VILQILAYIISFSPVECIVEGVGGVTGSVATVGVTWCHAEYDKGSHDLFNYTKDGNDHLFIVQ